MFLGSIPQYAGTDSFPWTYRDVFYFIRNEILRELCKIFENAFH